jgi:hypothetical protein
MGRSQGRVSWRGRLHRRCRGQVVRRRDAPSPRRPLAFVSPGRRGLGSGEALCPSGGSRHRRYWEISSPSFQCGLRRRRRVRRLPFPRRDPRRFKLPWITRPGPTCMQEAARGDGSIWAAGLGVFDRMQAHLGRASIGLTLVSRRRLASIDSRLRRPPASSRRLPPAIRVPTFRCSSRRRRCPCLGPTSPSVGRERRSATAAGRDADPPGSSSTSSSDGRELRPATEAGRGATSTGGSSASPGGAAAPSDPASVGPASSSANLAGAATRSSPGEPRDGCPLCAWCSGLPRWCGSGFSASATSF